MANLRIATRYAKSILDLGVEQNTLEDIYKDMVTLKEAMSNRDFKLFVKSPIIKASKKQSVFKAIFGDNLSKTTSLFFDLLAKKGRESAMPEIATSFLQQYKKYNKVSEIKLTTASALSESALNTIKSALLESDATDQKVEITTDVNPDLIGGFVIEMEDKLYDASIAHKLRSVKKQFLDNKYIKSN